MSHTDVDRLKARYERERLARKEAERLLEEKSLALYKANMALQASATQLEAKVNDRTAQLQRALELAESATRSKSDFLAMMSHEIRTPLNGIMGMIQLLMFSQPNPEQSESLRIMRQSADHLLALINEILDISKIEAGHLDLDVSEFQLEAELQSVAALYRPMAESKGLQFQVRMGPELQTAVRGDKVRIRQVISNLLSNAVKFTALGGVWVDLTGNREGDTLSFNISVEDSGVGITAEQMQRIFQPFMQADSSISREFGGTGLGLSIVERLVKAMGGTIEASARPEGGTRFRVSLILQTVSALPSMHKDYPAQVRPVGSGDLSVLVVDDALINRRLTLRMLELLGVRGEAVEDGPSAIKAVTDRHWDFILMDMQMPGMDGLETTRRIRSLVIPEQPCVIALTANAYESDRSRCLEAGMNDFLAKPLQMEALAEMLGVPNHTPSGRHQPGDQPS